MRILQNILLPLNRAALVLATAGCVAALTACGGGVFVGIGATDDTPPVVSVATAASSVQAGQTVRFVAAAADENGIDDVAFYLVETNDSTLLGRDSDEPYEWTLTAPDDGRTSLSVFARATDKHGNEADSAIVTIPITP